MAIENLEREEHLTGSTDRNFGFVIAAFLAIIGLWPLASGSGVRIWALLPAAAFLVLALLRPQALSGLNRLWMRLGVLLNRIVSPLALGAVFFLTVLPIGVLMRLGGKDPLRLRYDPAAKSYWVPREPPGPDPKTLVNQF
ncbi:MAG: SxtJ family membrane protein [Sterolibacteriaceae bacterium MAG5]|nr:SxtJ family membrane protein [Candidatus Nitricoxidireducens bremensis]